MGTAQDAGRYCSPRESICSVEPRGAGQSTKGSRSVPLAGVLDKRDACGYEGNEDGFVAGVVMRRQLRQGRLCRAPLTELRCVGEKKAAA